MLSPERQKEDSVSGLSVGRQAKESSWYEGRCKEEGKFVNLQWESRNETEIHAACCQWQDGGVKAPIHYHSVVRSDQLQRELSRTDQ